MDIPDYSGLATQQATNQQNLLNQQTANNRPNQTNPYGSSQWTQGPNGQWTQNTTLNGADQAHLDNNRNIQGGLDQTAMGLLGGVQNSMNNPLNTNGMPAWGGYDPSKLQGVDLNGMQNGQQQLDPGFGAVQGVRDAMMSRLSPQLQQAREQEVARLKSQGIPENSAIFQKSMEAKDQQFNDANQQALLGGAQEYGNIFNRGLALNNQKFGQNQTQQQMAMALRGQQFGEQGAMTDMNMKQRNAMLGEQQALRQQPLSDLKGLLAGNPSSPAFSQFNTAGQAQAPDLVGAASAQYQAQLAQQNANNASSSNTTNGLIGLGSSFLGSQAGNNLMQWGGNKLGDWLGGLWKP
jgi:hypothetical protein